MKGFSLRKKSETFKNRVSSYQIIFNLFLLYKQINELRLYSLMATSFEIIGLSYLTEGLGAVFQSRQLCLSFFGDHTPKILQRNGLKLD